MKLLSPQYIAYRIKAYSFKGHRIHFVVNVVFEKDSVLKDLQLEATERPLGLIIEVEGGRINGTLGKQEPESRIFWSRARMPWKKPEASCFNFVEKGWKADNKYYRTSSIRVLEGNAWELCVPQKQELAERIPP